MCGICGIAYPRSSARVVDEALLVRMRDAMAHRGPDDSGLFVDGQVGLGHRRLSIVDLGGGHQPMSNEDGSVWIVYNGEVYNHRSFRPMLEERGHVYRTMSDTEGIVHMYEERGARAVGEPPLALHGQDALQASRGRRRGRRRRSDRRGARRARPLDRPRHGARRLPREQGRPQEVAGRPARRPGEVLGSVRRGLRPPGGSA